MEIKNLFNNGDIVYLVTDPFQYKGIVKSIAKDWNGGVRYEVAFGTEPCWFQAIELSKEQDLSVVVNLNTDEDDDQ